MTNAVQEFNQLILGISKQLHFQGVERRPFASKERFPDLPAEIQREVVKRARCQLEQMELLRPNIQEHEKLSVICRFHKLRPVDDEVYERLTSDMAWEIIDFQLNQIYRSALVFELGNYAIEEYEAFSPWELFLRPQPVLAELMNVTRQLSETQKIINLESIKPYVIEEAYTAERAQFEIQHIFACPLRDETTGQNTCFISAFKLRPVSPDKRVILFHDN